MTALELFSEVFGAYYQMTSYLLQICGNPGKNGLTREGIQKLADRMGFAETSIYLLPKLLGEDGWPFLEKLSGTPPHWKSRLHCLSKRPLTLLERKWLSAVVSDPKAPLFLSYELLGRLSQALEGIAPLYQNKDFRCFDQYQDGDPYQSSVYQKNFRMVLSALQEGNAVEISFQAGTHDGLENPRIHRGVYLPLQLEFSEKDNKFRVYCQRLHHKKFAGYATINLGRVTAVSSYYGKFETPSERLLFLKWMEKQQCSQPVEVDVSPERNGVERFLVEFSSYKKETSFDQQTGHCQVKIWYQKADETEVLIRILGFGPVVRVLGPESFLQQVRARVALQAKRLEITTQVKSKMLTCEHKPKDCTTSSV